MPPVPPGTTKARTPSALKPPDGGTGGPAANPNEPQAEPGEPDPPDYLSERQRKAWDYFAVTLRDLGVLYRSDGAALEALACTWAQFIQLHDALREQAANGEDSLTYIAITEKGSDMRRAKPEVQLIKEVAVQVRDWLGKFGLSPADRGRVTAKAKAVDGPANPDDEFK